MENYRYQHAIEVRYGDLDPQGHVNNARFLTYLEQARVCYVRELGLWDGGSYLDIGVILADVQITYKAPILLTAEAQVCLRTIRLGNKSLTMDYCINDRGSGVLYATATTVQVAFDYHTQATIPIPVAWRQAIADFEGILPGP